MKTLCIVILMIVSLSMLVQPTQAQQLAPIQVQMEWNHTIVLYDCYPSGQVDELQMSVFLNTPNGTAVYKCILAEGAQVVPWMQLPENQSA